MKPQPFLAASRLRSLASLLLIAAGLTATGTVRAHGNTHGQAAPDMIETAFGRTGDPQRVTRTIQVRMSDSMRFDPPEIAVRQGDTIRLRVSNAGAVLHELVIGTEGELARQAELMRKNPDMEHDAPYMAHVNPGKRGDTVWQFTQPGKFKYGCLEPGHFEAGMVGTVKVVPR
jgi:uncharacterized cupredoxin-like copper-binding protein